MFYLFLIVSVVLSTSSLFALVYSLRKIMQILNKKFYNAEFPAETKKYFTLIKLSVLLFVLSVALAFTSNLFL